MKKHLNWILKASAFWLAMFAVGDLAAAAKALIPSSNQAVQAIGGAKANGDIIPILTDANGNLTLSTASATPVNGTVTVTNAGATDRTQFPTATFYSCTVQAYETNTGAVYIGGATVTNASGANRGIKLNQGDSISGISVTNSNQIWGAADTANDKIAWLCN